MGNLEAGRKYGQELAGLVPALGDQNMETGLEAGWGIFALAEGNPRAAVRHLKAAVQISHQLKMTQENINLTLLAQAYLANGNRSSALQATRKATAMHRRQAYAPPDGLSSQEMWWRHTQALLANKQYKAAREAMERAYQFLLTAIGNVRDEGLRRNVLNKVEANRELLQFWVKDGKRRRLPQEKLFAHLAIESSLREPFQRLADTGLRLNALHDLAGIRTFLVEEATELSGAERVLLILEKDGKYEVVESAFPYLLGGGGDRDKEKLLRSVEPYLKQARLTRTADLILPKKTGLSRIVAPLIAQNQVTGYLYVDMDSLYGTFNETDRDMLGMLANQAAVALDNAQWTQGLEQKVQERTEALNDRVNELAILNSVGDAMAKTLDVKTVSRIVGDKVAEIFHADNVTIELLEVQTGLIHETYNFDIDQGGSIDPIAPFPLGVGMTSRAIQTRQSILVGTLEEQARQGGYMPLDEIEKVGQDPNNFAQSEMVVPVVMGEQVIGAVIVAKKDRNAFNENDLRLLQTLSANMAVAIQNARLFEAEQQRVSELAVINSIQQGVAAELNFQSIVNMVGDKLREVFHTPDLAIQWYDEKTNLLQGLYAYEHGKPIKQPTVTPKPDGSFNQMRKIRKPIVWHTMAEGDAISSATYGDASLSGVHVPIISGDRVLGTMTLENYERENVFGESEIRVLTTVAAALGSALENAHLFDETQRLLKETEQRNAELAVINSIQQGLVAELNFQAIIDLVGERVNTIFASTSTSIGIYDRQKQSIHIRYSCTDGIHDPEITLPLGPGLFSRVIETRQPLLIGSIAEGTALGAVILQTGDKTDERPIESSMFVPLLAGGELTGVVRVARDEPNSYSENDLRLLQTLCASLSVALESARLFDETQRLLKETEQRNAELAIINEVQHGLAAELNFQAIIDLVGDKLRQVFTNGDIGIRWYDPQAKTLHFLYEYEHGERIYLAPEKMDETGAKRFEERRTPQFFNDRFAMAAGGIKLLPGTDQSLCAVMVPIIGSDRVIGQIDMENYERENAYSESDIRLLQTVASSMGVALENARLFDETQRLLKETEQRNAELAVINSIQQGLAAELNFQAIVDLVGDRLREVFNTPDLAINWYDEKTNLVHYLYNYEHGERITISSRPPYPGGILERMTKTHQPVVWNTVEEGDAITPTLPGTDASKSGVSIPIISGDRILGSLQLENYERENAFGESELRLLTTVAGSLGAALQNAFLFDETQRLLKETEQRNNELAIINSIQQGLASKLDFQAIVDLVGDKLREVFNQPDIGINWYDEKTNLLHYLYSYEHGKRMPVISITPTPGGAFETQQKTRAAVCFEHS